MRIYKNLIVAFLLVLVWLVGCKDESEIEITIPEDSADTVADVSTDSLTIFFINDQHGSIDNFAKLKWLVEEEKKVKNTLLVCAGDVFSGNPIVDQHSEKGLPMIDLMNQVGFDVAVLGNHEFDYGEEVLDKRMSESHFPWICANIDASASTISQPPPFVTLEVGSLRLTFLGLIETSGNGIDGATIPSTHPWRVQNLQFESHRNILAEYENLKEEEQSDALIALTHLGQDSDLFLARFYPFMDVIIGGHSHDIVNTIENEVSVVQAGADLFFAGKMEIVFQNKEIIAADVSFINLATVSEEDEVVKNNIAAYNDEPSFQEIIGFSEVTHTGSEVGCFYTEALKDYLKVDAAFQNNGGLRADLPEGDIQVLDIYTIDPFNNQGVIFDMSVSQIKHFFNQTGFNLHYAGISLAEIEGSLEVLDKNGDQLDDEATLSIGMNDFIPATFEDYFTIEDAQIQEETTAEMLINHLKSVNQNINYEACQQQY